METIRGSAFKKPFPHLIFSNFYNEQELDLIWEELNFYTKPDKLLEAKDFGGVVGKTNSHALALDSLYPKERRSISNILTVNRKLFEPEVLESFAKVDDCCSIAIECNYDITKVRYYHDGEYYIPHRDTSYSWLLFSYFHKKPKKFTGGELFFPDYDYEYNCDHNSAILIPGWVKHGVKEVKIDNSDYYDGYGRYAITLFHNINIQ